VQLIQRTNPTEGHLSSACSPDGDSDKKQQEKAIPELDFQWRTKTFHKESTGELDITEKYISDPDLVIKVKRRQESPPSSPLSDPPCNPSSEKRVESRPMQVPQLSVYSLPLQLECPAHLLSFTICSPPVLLVSVIEFAPASLQVSPHPPVREAQILLKEQQRRGKPLAVSAFIHGCSGLSSINLCASTGELSPGSQYTD
ncbi:hypothetical protein STEG23_025364, partial [Scotinomys teguina]